jgi:hypothetical protein
MYYSAISSGHHWTVPIALRSPISACVSGLMSSTLYSLAAIQLDPSLDSAVLVGFAFAFGLDLVPYTRSSTLNSAIVACIGGGVLAGSLYISIPLQVSILNSVTCCMPLSLIAAFHLTSTAGLVAGCMYSKHYDKNWKDNPYEDPFMYFTSFHYWRWVLVPLSVLYSILYSRELRAFLNNMYNAPAPLLPAQNKIAAGSSNSPEEEDQIEFANTRQFNTSVQALSFSPSPTARTVIFAGNRATIDAVGCNFAGTLEIHVSRIQSLR